MRLKGATTVLKKQAEFLGMTFEEVLVFIEKNPYCVKNSTIDAFAVWKKETNKERKRGQRATSVSSALNKHTY